jgi:hypothetical protein
MFCCRTVTSSTAVVRACKKSILSGPKQLYRDISQESCSRTSSLSRKRQGSTQVGATVDQQTCFGIQSVALVAIPSDKAIKCARFTYCKTLSHAESCRFARDSRKRTYHRLIVILIWHRLLRVHHHDRDRDQPDWRKVQV